GATRDQLSAVAVKNHDNGLNNPNAQYQMKLTVQQVNESVMVADPLRILDCSPITDGAAALILCPLNRAKEFSDKPPIKIIGCGMATDSIALHDRRNLTSLDAVRISAEQALKMAGKTINDINVTEVHDCFTIAEIIVSEALGMFPAGKGALACVNGETRIEGKFPINASGGLKSKGHPVGATGVAQAIEIVHQLRGEAGKRQVKNAKVGMTQNMGGSGGSSVVHIMEVA
ncbi:MAG: thiolase domain-containing protein, partial [Candidatus Zixiibacteriota bacterium]